MAESYQHRDEVRTELEIELMRKIARGLTDLNIKRVKMVQQNQGYNISESQFFFVCISGIPPFENEFENLGLPGQKVVIALDGLKGEFTEEEYIQIFNKPGFETEAHKIRSIITKVAQKKIVVIYHSFGSFSLTCYLRLFGHDHRIQGFIDIGGATIRFYPLLFSFVFNKHSLKKEDYLKNMDIIHKLYHEDKNIKNAGFIPFKNKYQTIIFSRLCLEQEFKSTFETLRNLPKVLKLFIYGRSDRIFPEDLINEKIMHYSLRNVLEFQYEQRVREAFRKVTNSDAKNVQDKFFYDVEGGQHSIHMQSRFNELIRSFINEYLRVLASV